jgi:hypothetical protein
MGLRWLIALVLVVVSLVATVDAAPPVRNGDRAGPVVGFAASVVVARTIWISSSALACLSFFLLGVGPINGDVAAIGRLPACSGVFRQSTSSALAHARLARDARQLRTSFVGLSFYRSIDGDQVRTSTAQMFDERGEGLILRGGRMVESEEDRRPHLTAIDAFELLRGSLKVFRDQHGHWPARVVLHKTSKFDRNELDDFHKAIDERDIDYADFVWVQKSLTRLYRLGVYPPLRGTLLRFDKDQALLYTRGSVEFFRTYPGMYVPRALQLRCQALGQPLQHVADEMLALTKMNWNNTQFDNGLPITIAAAGHAGEVLKTFPRVKKSHQVQFLHVSGRALVKGLCPR